MNKNTISPLKTETAIIVLNYNGLALLKELLPISISNTEISEEVQLIVADNNSSDESVSWLKANYPEIYLLEFEENHGFAGGYNKAVELIESTYTILLSSDVEVAPNWLPPIIKELKENKSTGACQPKVKSYHRRNEFEYAGAAGGFIDNWGVPFCRGRLFDVSEVDTEQYETREEIFWASGCCFAVNREAFLKTGGLDVAFFAHMEEIDLCWRMQGLGYKIVSIPSSVVYHMGGQTLSYDNPKKLYLNCRNNYAMLFKNWPTSTLIIRIPFKILIDWLGAIHFLFKKGWGSFWAIIKGQIDFFLRLSHWLKIRKKTTRISIKNTTGIYPKSIIFAFFIKNKKKYTELS